MIKQLNEMARFGENLECGKNKVDIELHGGDDRIYPPHIHMYHSAERKSKSKMFTIEVNLAYLLWTGEVVPCRIYDKKKSVDRMNSTDTNWVNYLAYRQTIIEFLFDGDVKPRYSDCIDNIAVSIKVFNEEANLQQLHAEDKKKLSKFGNISQNDKFLAVMYCYGRKIKREFKKYFSQEQIAKFKELFE